MYVAAVAIAASAATPSVSALASTLAAPDAPAAGGYGVNGGTSALASAVVFTDSHSGDLLRLALGVLHTHSRGGRLGSSTSSAEGKLTGAALQDPGPVVIAEGLEPYGGLLVPPWAGRRLLVAGKGQLVMSIDPWCAEAEPGAAQLCPSQLAVDVRRALALDAQTSFHLGDMTLCDGALYIVYAGNCVHECANATDSPNGVLRCTGCVAGEDCTDKCAPVMHASSPGDGPRQLGGYAAGLSCAAHGPHENAVLVVDNTNSRILAIPSACARAPCNVSTYAQRMHFPLALAVLPAAGHTRAAGQERVLVSLDATIGVLSQDGTQQHLWARQDDCGYLSMTAGGRVLAAVGDIVAFDAACARDCAPSKQLVWNASSSRGKARIAYGALAYLHRPQPRAVQQGVQPATAH